MQGDLVARAQQGDHEAFTELASDALARLHRIARLIVRDDDRASDAVQEALLEAWRDIRAVRDPDRFDAWLHRLLVRACYREANRARRQRVREIHVETLEATASTDVARAVVARDQVDRGFRSLTTEHRAVLVVHYYLGLRDAEASGMLAIPLGTYKSRLNRATAALRAAIEADTMNLEPVGEPIT